MAIKQACRLARYAVLVTVISVSSCLFSVLVMCQLVIGRHQVNVKLQPKNVDHLHSSGACSSHVHSQLILSASAVGATQPIAATIGFFTVGGSTQQTRTGQQACSIGNACVSGVKTPCPLGRYHNETMQSTCRVCPSG